MCFAPTAGSPIPQPMYSSDTLEKDIVLKPLQMYTKHFKNVVSTLLLVEIAILL